MFSRYIIHTVGPIYDEDTDAETNEKAELLASCYKTSLQLAIEHDLKHVVRESLNSYASSD
jgi:O-acetyl-ADP-ribose deacetylase